MNKLLPTAILTAPAATSFSELAMDDNTMVDMKKWMPTEMA